MAANQHTQQTEKGPDKASCSVWLVEDDEAVSGALQFSLGVEGFKVEAFRTGEEALAVALAGSVCCRLILDFLLPDTNGMHLLRQLREVGVRAPAIIITTNPGVGLRAQASLSGATIVEKPLMRDALIKALDDAGCFCGHGQRS